MTPKQENCALPITSGHVANTVGRVLQSRNTNGLVRPVDGRCAQMLNAYILTACVGAHLLTGTLQFFYFYLARVIARPC